MSVRTLNLGSADLSTPAVRVEPAVLNDTDDLDRSYKSLWANTDGTVTFIPIENDEKITLTVIGGTPIPFTARRVLASGTTADIIGVIA